MKRLLIVCVAFALCPMVNAYEMPVHFSLTMWLAETAGFSEVQAFEFAKFDQGMDDNPNTDPEPMTNYSARRDYHFVSSQRLQQLKSAALVCQGPPNRFNYESVGQHLHALEDSYSHKGYEPKVGHVIAWKTPDKPWSVPEAFVGMVRSKFEFLIELNNKCGQLVGTDITQRNFAQAMTKIEAWSEHEKNLGVGATGGQARWEDLVRSLYGSRQEIYTNARVQAYNEWKARRQREGWRQ